MILKRRRSHTNVIRYFNGKCREYRYILFFIFKSYWDYLPCMQVTFCQSMQRNAPEDFNLEHMLFNMSNRTGFFRPTAELPYVLFYCHFVMLQTMVIYLYNQTSNKFHNMYTSASQAKFLGFSHWW